MSAKPWPPRDDAAYRAEAAAGLAAELIARLEAVRLIVLDCDGILTDGSLIYGPDGEALKTFNARDGLGLALARAGGLQCALLTGRDSPTAARRAKELRFAAVKLGRFDKQRALHEILKETAVDAAATLYMGDDLIDIPALDLAAVAVTVPAAPADVQARCDLVTRAPGGSGAVREIIDILLGLQGRTGAALEKVAARAWLPTGEDA